MVTGTFTYPAQRASRLDPIEVLRRGSWPCRRNFFRASREAGSSSRRLRVAFGDGHQASPPIGATGDVEQVLAAVSDTALTDGDDVIDVLGFDGGDSLGGLAVPISCSASTTLSGGEGAASHAERTSVLAAYATVATLATVRDGLTA